MDGVGKKIRWSRFLYGALDKGVIVPIDHGLTLGPIAGLRSVAQIARWIRHPAITGIIAHKGMVERLGGQGLLKGLGVMMHLNGMTATSASPDRKEMVTSLEAALRLGADAVSLQLNFDGTNEAHNLAALGAVVDQAQAEGLPVLTMLYDKVESARPDQRLTRIRHLIRASVELGTDALKISAPEDLALIPELLEGVHEHTAVFFAGGPRCSEQAFLRLTAEAVGHGATGLCVGRNVFQSESPADILTQVQALIQEMAS